MRSSSITLLLAMGVLAFVGCGDGGGDPSFGTVPLDDGSYQKPPTTKGPTDYQTPPTTYQKPGGGMDTSGGGSEASLCETYCSLSQAAGCPTDEPDLDDLTSLPLQQCLLACSTVVEGVPCEGELGLVVSCVFAQTEVTCDLLQDFQDGETDDIDDSAILACSVAVQAYNVCVEENDEDNLCRPPNDCEGCLDDCSRCGCENFEDQDECDDVCAN